MRRRGGGGKHAGRLTYEGTLLLDRLLDQRDLLLSSLLLDDLLFQRKGKELVLHLPLRTRATARGKRTDGEVDLVLDTLDVVGGSKGRVTNKKHSGKRGDGHGVGAGAKKGDRGRLEVVDVERTRVRLTPTATGKTHPLLGTFAVALDETDKRHEMARAERSLRGKRESFGICTERLQEERGEGGRRKCVSLALLSVLVVSRPFVLDTGELQTTRSVSCDLLQESGQKEIRTGP